MKKYWLFIAASLVFVSVSAKPVISESSATLISSGALSSNAGKTLDKTLALIANNSPWASYAQFLDYPDAGVPDCGMFIESFVVARPIVNKDHAKVAVTYWIKGEFAGTDYYLYPKLVKRIINYELVFSDRNWKVREESGLTDYLQYYSGSKVWKIHNGDIRLLYAKYFKWHMGYYNQGSEVSIIHKAPPTHCWD